MIRRGHEVAARVFAILSACCVALIVSFLPGNAKAEGETRLQDMKAYSISHNGVDRTFELYVPASYAPGNPAPVIIAVHGRFSSGKALNAISHLQQVADARGAILVFPEAAGSFWGDGGHAYLARHEPETDDISFINHLMQSLQSDYAIDRERIFLVGHDGGSAMALRLLCQQPAQMHFAAVSIVSALMWQPVTAACSQLQAPVSILFVHGRDSELFPVSGKAGETSQNASRLSVNETIGFWRKHNGCGAPNVAGDDGSVSYGNCAAGSSLAYVGVPDGLQAWSHSGAAYRLNRHDVDTTGLLDRFFFDRAAFNLPYPRADTAKARDYILYVPPTYNPGTPTPIVVMLHGRPSNAAEMARITNMNAVAGKHGFIVVYPEGLKHEWNAQFDLYNKSSHSVHTAGLEPAGLMQDDVGFLKTLTLDLGIDLNIDRHRMYIAGFSNGGFMTLRMACSASDTFAAFAEGGSALYTVMTDICKRGRPAPMFFMHGTADPSIPIDGVRTRDGESGMPTRVTLSVKETVALFARRNGCAEKGVMTTYAESGRSPGTKVQRFVPNGCHGDTPVVFYIIEGGGHTWSGVPGVLDEARFGKTNMDINASELIWEFFSPQRLGN